MNFFTVFAQFVFLSALYAIFLHSNPLRFLISCLSALLCAIGSSSSTVSLPYTLYSLEQQANLDRRVTRFLIPTGTVLNKNGTTLWLALTITYLYEIRGLEISVAKFFIFLVSAIFFSFATATIPSGGIFMALMMLRALGIPESALQIILPAEWVVDRIRTAVNVYGNMIAIAVVTNRCAKKLAETSERDESRLNN